MTKYGLSQCGNDRVYFACELTARTSAPPPPPQSQIDNPKSQIPLSLLLALWPVGLLACSPTPIPFQGVFYPSHRPEARKH